MQLTSTQPMEAQAEHIRRPSEVEGMLRFLQERKRSNKLVPQQPRLYPIFRATPNIQHQTPRDESMDITQHTTKNDFNHRHNKTQWVPPRTIYIRTIPITELDDPPDSASGADSGGLLHTKDKMDFLRSQDSDLSSGYG